MAKKTIITPVGVAKFPHIAKPDNYKGDEKYKLRLLITKEEAEALKKQILEFASTNKTITAKKPKVSIKPEIDKEDNPTGLYELSAKSKYQPIVKDSKNQKLEEVPRIAGGSKLRLLLELVPYDEGVSLRLLAVQIIELVTYGDGGYDFDEVEDGFEAEPKEADEADFSEATEDALDI